jgi:hypothetical protein
MVGTADERGSKTLIDWYGALVFKSALISVCVLSFVVGASLRHYYRRFQKD